MVVSLIQDITDYPTLDQSFQSTCILLGHICDFYFLISMCSSIYSFKFTEGKGKKSIKIMAGVIIYSVKRLDSGLIPQLNRILAVKP